MVAIAWMVIATARRRSAVGTIMKTNRALILLLVIWSLAPLIWQVYTSFCTDQALVMPFAEHAQRWTLAHYQSVLNSDPPFLKYSTVCSQECFMLTLILALPASHSLSKLNQQTATLIKALLIGCALFPYAFFLALLEVARFLHLATADCPGDSLCRFVATLGCFVTNAFADLPTELEDAARVEGLSLLQRFRWILRH